MKHGPAMLAALIALSPLLAAADSPSVETISQPNPRLKVWRPVPGGVFEGYFAVEIENFYYAPQLATSPALAFAIGVNNTGAPLQPSVGHLHGWVFKLGPDGHLARNDGAIPLPGDYYRFYGAGAASTAVIAGRLFWFQQDKLERGQYMAFFQLQRNDHTPATQASAAAFPSIAVVRFTVK